MENDFDISKRVFAQITAEELEQAKQSMLQFIWDWVAAKYSNIRLATVERNLSTFVWLKRYDDACKNCMSTQMCPSLDGNRVNGKLMADGVVTVWMEPCPMGYKPSRNQEEQEVRPQRRWSKSQ